MFSLMLSTSPPIYPSCWIHKSRTEGRSNLVEIFVTEWVFDYHFGGRKVKKIKVIQIDENFHMSDTSLITWSIMYRGSHLSCKSCCFLWDGVHLQSSMLISAMHYYYDCNISFHFIRPLFQSLSRPWLMSLCGNVMDCWSRTIYRCPVALAASQPTVFHCWMCTYAGHDCSVRLWNVETKTCVQELTVHRKKFDESVNDVTFHPSKPLIASAGADAVAKVYVWFTLQCPLSVSVDILSDWHWLSVTDWIVQCLHCVKGITE